jgi:hypothetical protein
MKTATVSFALPSGEIRVVTVEAGTESAPVADMPAGC